MPVWVIDTLKPKNGLDFPVVEAIDVAVEGYSSLADAVTHFATDTAIAAINAALSDKANTSDVNTAVANLQNQINQIEISASAESVVAPEVAAARVGADGTVFTTLKERCDADFQAITDQILLDIEWIEGKFINNTGARISNEYWKCTDYIEINSSINIPIKYTVHVINNTYIALYDSDKHLIRAIQLTNSETVVEVSGIIDNYEGATYIAFSSFLSQPTYIAYYYPDAALAENAVKTASIENDAVTAEKLAILEHDPNSNFINYDTISEGKYIYSDGTLRTSIGVNATDFIKLNAGTQYFYSKVWKSYYAFYNENHELIASYDTLGDLSGGTFTTPANTAYGRFTVADDNYNAKSAWLSKTNSQPEEYGYKFNIPITVSIPDESIDESKIVPKSLTVEAVDFIEHDAASNYISGWVENAYINSGVETHLNGFYATEPVYLEEGVQYYYSSLYGGYYAFYAEDGTVLEYHNINDRCPNPFTIPEGCKYARFTAVDEAMKNAGWVFTERNAPPAYRMKLSDNIYAESDIYAVSNPCDFLGDDIIAFTKCLCVGDSLTSGTFNYRNSGSDQYVEYDKYSYPRNLERMTGLEVTNMGIGGDSSGEWYAAKSSTDLSGYDIAIIQLGVNDNYRRESLGMTIEEWFEDTTRCGFSDIITKLKNENNNIKIFVANIIPATAYHSASFIAFSDYLLNWVQTTYASDKNVIPLDMMQYAHTMDKSAYNCGHLSAYGYYRLAKDYKSYISWYMSKNSSVFREIQFIGTDKWYINPNA